MIGQKLRIKWMILAGLTICIMSWGASVYRAEHAKQVRISFPYINVDNIDPDKVSEEIAKALGYPHLVPTVTKEGRFWGVLVSHPQQSDDMKIQSLHSSFIVHVPDQNKERILSCEFYISGGELVITYRKEMDNGRRRDEEPHLIHGYALSNLLSALKDFPVDSYRERTEFGYEHADLYEIRLNSEAPIAGEDFSYNRDGYIENDEEGIPFILSHLQWGRVKNASLSYNDPLRYYSYGGEGKANLFYRPENY
ncbi:hypothetical protein [Paenibacillus tepidiphilus]|uniref:hypothetical protein n=1 Tax=Paenibacillus tepidiphilus TaxID=2608683 RepID=UPI001239123C|nr:hypothetical protein [Paenibacillus tepidiphilus]